MDGGIYISGICKIQMSLHFLAQRDIDLVGRASANPCFDSNLHQIFRCLQCIEPLLKYCANDIDGLILCRKCAICQ